MKWMTLVAAAVAAGLVLVLLGRLGTEDELPVLGEVTDFRLVQSSGEPIGRADLLGQVWVANFIFTSCPSFCPRLSEQMASVQRRLDGVDAIRLVSFSVDPGTDTPQVLREYGERWGAVPGRWLFVTGERRSMYELVRDGFKLAVEERSPEEAADGQGIILHSDRFVLVDSLGRIRGYFAGTDDGSVAELVAATLQLARER
jgi:protein SCO1/2